MNVKQVIVVIVLIGCLLGLHHYLSAIYHEAPKEDIIVGGSDLFSHAEFLVRFVATSLPLVVVAAVSLYFLRNR